MKEKLKILIPFGYQKVIISLSKSSKFLNKVRMLNGSLVYHMVIVLEIILKRKKQNLHFRCFPSASCLLLSILQPLLSFHTNWTSCPPASGRPDSVLIEPLLMCVSVLYSAVPSCSYYSKVTGQFLTLCLSQGIRTKAHD